MILKQKLQKLAVEKNSPCVTISLNTHCTYPDIQKDEILLKNLLQEAEKRVINEFDKREVTQLLKNIERVVSKIDLKYNLNSLHIFISNDTLEFIKSPWETSNQGVHISDTFATRSIIKTYTRSENYLIMLLTQSGVQLYEAVNDSIIEEVINDDFPFLENTDPNTSPNKISDVRYLDNLMKEFFNKVDKAMLRIHNETDLRCIVISTQENWNTLQQVADRPDIYLGHSDIDYNNIENPKVVEKSWKLVKDQQKE